MLKRLFAALPLSVFILAVSSLANAENAFGGHWPLLPEGTSPAEGEVWGELPNGLRYVIVPTDSSSDAVSLRLLVAAGQAQEAKGKAGTSLLLSDLAKAGTTGYSREKLVQFMLGNGMDPQSRSFSDIDANNTVYRFNLEEPSAGSVEMGLGILAEIAGAPAFSSASFDAAKERLAYVAGLGVSMFEPKLLSLERVLLRSSSYSDLGDARIAADISSVELADVKSYWSKWYRADRMVVVVTGVVDSASVEAAVKAAFSPLEKHSEVIPVEALSGKFRSSGDIEAADSATQKSEFWITNVSDVGSLFDPAAELNYYVLDFIGRIAQSYATGSERLPNSTLAVHGNHVALSVNRGGSVVKLLEDMSAADKAMHRLAEFGIRSEDLERAKKDYIELCYSYDPVVSAKEWASLVADRAVRSVIDQVPFRYGASFSDYLQRVVSGVTFESARARCMELFREKSLSYYIEFPKGFPLGAKALSKRLKAMRKGYDHTWEQAGQADQKWNLGSNFQANGMVESTEIIRFEEYPVLKYEFSNNLRMNLIRTDAFPGRVQVYISFGNGTSGLESANPAFESILRTLLPKTKIGQGVEAPTVRTMLEAKGIENFESGVTKDNLYWSGQGRDASDVEEFLSAIMLWMVMSDLDEDMYNTEYENLEKVVERSGGGNSSVRLDELLFSNDVRLRSYFKEEDVEALDYKSIRDWLRSVRETSYIEITVVGDVVPRTVLRDVRKTFGSAPSRTGKVLQPRHAKPVVWNDAGIVHETFKMSGSLGNVTIIFPQVVDKSCSGDRLGSVFLPLFEEHLQQALVGYPSLSGNLSVDLVGNEMIPLSNGVRVRIYCPEDLTEKAESLIMSAAGSFSDSLTEVGLIAAERKALIGMKRIAVSQSALIDLFKQSQGKPKTLGCVVSLLESGFGVSLDGYKEIAQRQFSEENVRGVVLVPKQ